MNPSSFHRTLFALDPPHGINTGFVSQTVDGTTEKLGGVLQARSLSPITHVGFRLGARTGTPPTYRVSLQSVSTTTGYPTGTVLGGGSPASQTFTPPASTAWDATWQWIALANSYTPATRNEYIALVIDYSSGTINTSNCVSFTYRIGYDDDQSSMPYCVVDTGAGYSKNGRPFGFGRKTSDGEVFGMVFSSRLNTQYTSTDNPDAYGMKFIVPRSEVAWASALWTGIQWIGTSSGSGLTYLVEVLDITNGTTLISDTVDTDFSINSGSRYQTYTFSSAVTLVAGDTYAVMLEALGANSMGLSRNVSASSSDRKAAAGGENCWLVTRVNGGALTDNLLARPDMSLDIYEVQEVNGVGRGIGRGM